MSSSAQSASAEPRPSSRSEATRAAIISAAERLFAEHGIHAVSNRQVSEAAGQGNNTAVGYHFGSKADLVGAILAEHSRGIDRGRADFVRDHAGSTDVRTWVSAQVLPLTDHLAGLGRPSWYARFGAQVMADPELGPAMVRDRVATQALRIASTNLALATPDLPEGVRDVRSSITRILLVHGCAEFERYLASGDVADGASWERCGIDLVDAIVGVWTAPITKSNSIT